MKRTPSPLWDFPAAAVLVIILLTVGQRLLSTNWAWGMGSAIILVLMGAVLGMALGLSKFKPITVFWLMCGYSILMIFLILGGILYQRIPWLERLSDLADRLAYAFSLYAAKQPVHDTILFIVFITLVFWIIGLVAGFAFTRHGNFIGAVVPAGAALLIIQLYDPGKASNNTFLAVYFFLCLLFLGRLSYVQRRLFWKEHRLYLQTESKADLNITLAVVSLVTVLIVWMAPTSVKSFSDAKATWQNLTRPLRDMQKELGHAVAGLQGGRKASTVQFFGDTLPLGDHAASGDSAYLSIQTPLVNDTSRYYWRVRSYNIFLNGQWSTENISNTLFSPDQAFISLADPEGFPITFDITDLSVNMADVVTPPRPVWVSAASELFYVEGPEGKMDPIRFQANPPILAGKKYSVSANSYEPSIARLRSAGGDYPDWVTKNYQQLPESLPAEVTVLAQQITAGAETPYDMAEAITQYLRDNITYVSTVEVPPEGRDPVDWFLFDSRKGYCNYYATAEVILLRAVGIPARMVVGFAQGEFVSPDTYVVRQRDTHAWPEVYFPEAGWVEFEPTANQVPLERPLNENPTSPGEDEAQTHAQMSKRDETGQEDIPSGGNVTTGRNEKLSGWVRLANWFLRLAFLALLSTTVLWFQSIGTFDTLLRADRQGWRQPLPVLLKQFLEKRALTPPNWLLRWAYQAELNPLERSFTTVYQSLHWLGEKPSPAQTPAEASDVLTGLLPNVASEIHSLSEEYQNHLYGPRHGYLRLTRRAEKTIRREALRVAIQKRWKALIKRDRKSADQRTY